MSQLGDVRSDLFDALSVIQTANVYRWPRVSYKWPAVVIAPDSMDVRPDQGDQRDFVVNVQVGVPLGTDPDSSADALDVLIDLVVDAIKDHSEWDPQPGQFSYELTADGERVAWFRVPVSVFA